MRPAPGEVAMVVLGCAGSALAGPVFTEDFDDGVLDPVWTAFAEDPAILDVVEQNGRLDFPTGENPDSSASAGVIATGWSLDASQGPDDPNAVLVEGLGAASGACDVLVVLAAFDDGVVPALPADALWIDDLRVTAGRVISTCVGDFDCSGGVGFNDLTLLLGAWGPGFAVEADLDGDGSVGFNDLTRLLGAWGPCS
jgi:hypothetical protein